MGGFYFDTSTKQPYISGSPNLILTSKAMYLFTKTSPPLLPEIAEGALKTDDRADKYMRCLVALQLLFQLALCVTLWAEGLAVSPLELNLLGHIMCAFVIYFCWFQKPQHVKLRTRIDEKWSDALCAYLCMCMGRNFWLKNPPPHIEQLFPILVSDVRLQDDAIVDTDKQCNTGDEKTKAGSEDAGVVRDALSKARLISDSRRARKHFSDFRGMLASNLASVLRTTQPLNLPVNPSEKRDVRNLVDNWRPLNPAVDTARIKKLVSPMLNDGFRPAAIKAQDDTSLACVNLALQYFDFWYENVVTSLTQGPDGPAHITNITKGMKAQREWTGPPFAGDGTVTIGSVSIWPQPNRSLVWYIGLVLPQAVFALFAACYGGIQASAWFYHFPSLIEAILWRVSSVIIIASGILVLLDRLIIAVSSQLTDRIVCRNCHAGQPWVDYYIRDAMWLPQCLQAWMKPFTGWRSGVLDYVSKSLSPRCTSKRDINHPISVKLPIWICLALVLAARIFVVIEALISLRSLSRKA